MAYERTSSGIAAESTQIQEREIPTSEQNSDTWAFEPNETPAEKIALQQQDVQRAGHVESTSTARPSWREAFTPIFDPELWIYAVSLQWRVFLWGLGVTFGTLLFIVPGILVLSMYGDWYLGELGKSCAKSARSRGPNLAAGTSAGVGIKWMWHLFKPAIGAVVLFIFAALSEQPHNKVFWGVSGFVCLCFAGIWFVYFFYFSIGSVAMGGDPDPAGANYILTRLTEARRLGDVLACYSCIFAIGLLMLTIVAIPVAPLLATRCIGLLLLRNYDVLRYERVDLAPNEHQSV